MADDIVTRLRDFAAVSMLPIVTEAADEIERLRAAGDALAAAAIPHGCSTGFFPCWCEEARRG